MTSAFKELVERKVVQWTLGYLAAAWGTLEAVGFLADLYEWGQIVPRVTVILLAAGLPAVMVLAWYHGASGPQKVTRIEAGLLSMIATGGVLAAILFGPAATDAGVDGHELAVAVLPPANLTGDAGQQYFVDGMHDALISQLSQVGALRVISKRSTVRYGASDLSIPEIATELGVDAVVESSVTRSGDSVGLNVRLIQAVPQERLIWSETFDAVVRNVLPMHGEVARAIAREVDVGVTADQQTRLAMAEPVDPAMYESYLRGMHLLGRGTPQDFQRGLEYLHQAVNQDPGEALAYAGLAMGYATLGHGPAPPPDAWPRAMEAAERAVALDPNLAEAQAALADVKLYYEWDWEGAERAFRRANQLNPNLAFNRYHYAWFLCLMGRNGEAIVQHRLAKQLDPLTPVHTAWLGGLYMWAGRGPEEAIAEARQAVGLDSTALPALHVLGDAYLEAGRVDEAIETHRKLVDLSSAGAWILGRTYAAAGMEDEARRIIDEIDHGDETIPWNAFGLILIHTALGQYDQAFRWVEHEPHHAWLPWAAVAPWTARLRDHPRYPDFLDRLDLPSRGIQLASGPSP